MRILYYLIQKELKQMFRNPVILAVISVVPIMQLLILPLVADYEVKNISISIVDHDHSSFSQKLVNKIKSSTYFKLNDYGNSYERAFQEFQEDHSDLILEIPSNFEKDLLREDHAGLLISVNAINGTKAIIGNFYLSNIILDFNSDVRINRMPMQKINVMPAIDIVNVNWFNSSLDYTYFMVPGFLVLLVTMVGVFMSSLNIAKEKELGTIEQINVTPIKKQYFILGKLIPVWFICIFVFSFGLFGVARLVYGIVPLGSTALLFSFLAVFLFSILGIGLFISTFSNNQQQSMSLALFFMMVFMLMSGLFTPVDSMPNWAQWIAFCSPVTYFIDVMRMVVLKGSGFADIRTHFLIVGIMSIFFNGLAILNYKKTSN